MSESENRHGGIPTRAIHEAYLDMERALKRYRQARDTGDQQLVDDAHGDVQETVLTFYDLLRPHIKHNDGVNDYWGGSLPSYNGDDTPPDPEDGKGVLQVQNHMNVVPYDQINTDEADTTVEQPQDLTEVKNLKNWHHMLRLNGNQVLSGIQLAEHGVVASVDKYELGLRRLDDWQTDWQTKQTTIGGFLGGTQTETTERQRVDMARLRRAARELSDVAEKLGALSEFDASTPRTEISGDLVEEVEEWRKANLQ